MTDLPKERSRPSTIGARVGQALAELEAAGRAASAEPIPEACLTCAFRPGTLPNQQNATVLDAYRCAVGADPAFFACHHGMKDGEPTRSCAGYVAALSAPFDAVKEISARMAADIQTMREADPDPIREAFDQWIATVDPSGKMNDYVRARLYARVAKGEATP